MPPSPASDPPRPRGRGRGAVTEAWTVSVALADDRGGARVPLRWVHLPAGRAGLLLCRWPDQQTTRQSADAPTMSFQPVDRPGLPEAAVAMARLPHIRSVVICPAGEMPLRAAVAVAVGDLLARRTWPDSAGVVTCGSRPLVDSGLTVVSHAVHLLLSHGQTLKQVVWQIRATDQPPPAGGAPPVPSPAGPGPDSGSPAPTSPGAGPSPTSTETA